MKAVGVVAGLGIVSLLAISVKRRGPEALAKACHGLMAARMQEHCGGQTGEAPSCGAPPVREAKTDPGEAGQTTACAEAGAEA